MGAVLEGDRSGFARCGPKERFAEDMILRAREGSYDWIYGILRDGLASADVADAKGYTVLAAAAVSPPPGAPGRAERAGLGSSASGAASSQPRSGGHGVR